MNLIFRSHAIKRMFERNVRPEDVRHVLATGKTIREYPDDTPYPSRLILGWVAGKPLHVVVAEDAEAEASIIIREPLKIQISSRCRVAHKKLLLTYQTYAASQFFARALPSLEI